ncbi:class C sortase [Arthrobacter sp. NPDC090010]|uniref:class C sortase n=1 Tax=Arthrobacter sp. NPDC090010 TaxID=3363942 RepID=UPI0038278B54
MPGRRGGGGRRPTGPIAIFLCALLGLGLLLYPSAAEWFSTIGHNTQISGYAQAVRQLPDARQKELLANARAYNSALPGGQLRDPYSPAAAQDQSGYQRQLAVGDGGVMGRLRYERLGIDLPILHGTSADTLAHGVGHLFGSSLPVGGVRTHSVLTAHSGYINAPLFDRLHEAREGDVFTLNVLGSLLRYRVDRIRTVEPRDISALSVEDGEDRVTLLTCTPIGVNSHRLLVQATRIDPGKDVAPSEVRMAGEGKEPGFPWWAALFLAGAAGAAALLFPGFPRAIRTSLGVVGARLRARTR